MSRPRAKLTPEGRLLASKYKRPVEDTRIGRYRSG